jgi:hypothetical protein
VLLGRPRWHQLVGLAVAAPLLAVRAVDLDHGDAGGGEMAGESGAVGAVPSTPTRSIGPKDSSQPTRAWQTRRCRRERLDAEQPADRVDRSGDVHVKVGVDTASDRARRI